MKVNHRVRGIILIGADRILVIKRIKPNRPHTTSPVAAGSKTMTPRSRTP